MPYLAAPAVAPGSLAAHDQPVLRGAGLVARPWSAADVDALVVAYSDPDIQQWHARSMDALEASEWVAAQAAHWTAERRVDWAVVDLDDAVVGRASLSTMNLADGVAGAGYWVMPDARGQGVAGAALAMVADWAFTVGFVRIEVEHSTRNPASCRVATKAGYPVEGVRRASAKHADGWHDMHVHARVGGAAATR